MTLYRCTFRAPAPVLDALSDCLFEAGAEGLEEGGTGESLTTYVPSAELAQPLLDAFDVFRGYVARVFPDLEIPDAEVEIHGDDWQSTWLGALEPQALTSRFVLRPTTRRPAPADEATIWFEPSESFGAGNHATTALAAQALEDFVRERPGLDLLDVGSGNGVLAFVALLSGAARAVGVDTNPTAARALRTNAVLNGVEARVSSHHGSLELVEGAFPLVVANIDTATLIRLAPDLVAHLEPGGTLWLTGLLDEDADRVARAFTEPGLTKPGLTERPRRSRDGWTLLQLSAP